MTSPKCGLWGSPQVRNVPFGTRPKFVLGAEQGREFLFSRGVFVWLSISNINTVSEIALLLLLAEIEGVLTPEKALWALNDGIYIKQFQPPRPKPAFRNNISSIISAVDMGISDEEWERLQKALEWPIPDQEITHVNQSTSPVHSTFSIVGLKESYKVGEKISVIIRARDHNKKLKRYGGDFFKAKLYSTGLKASVYGEVVDHHNGTYSVALLLPWEGQAHVHVRLEHSSEVVQILKKYRDSSFPRSHYNGYFEGSGSNKTRISEVVECNLKWGADGKDRDHQISFISSYKSIHIATTVISSECLFVLGTVEKCRSGMMTPVPAGFYLRDVWKSFVCNTRQFSSAQMGNCLKNKIVYLMGDSTTRQWFEYLERNVPGIKRMDLQTPRTGGPLMAVELINNIIIHWRPHGVPLRFTKMLITDLHYISNDIDEIAGGPHAVIVFTFFAHLVFHPITFYVYEVAKIRQSVVALLSRAPETTVIIKSGNTMKVYSNIFQSDWHVLQLDTVMQEMFRDIEGVIYLDVWQMTSCHYLSEDIHPGPVIVANEVNMLLSYVCPI
uniref:NXPE C-terminal domain-containing protein n=1 Tax=Cyprinus carpio TaxID=7962 RepID=A0A8C1IVK2_CYPCA